MKTLRCFGSSGILPQLLLLPLLLLLSLSNSTQSSQLVSSPRDVARRRFAAGSSALLTALAASSLSRPRTAAAATSSTSLSKVKAAAPAASSSSPSQASPPPPEGFLNGLVSGAASRASKELILHPLDTYKARLQVPQYATSNNASAATVTPSQGFDNLYDGVTAALIGGIPAGALFFATKDYSKSKLQKLGLSKEAATLISVSLAQVPYWALRTPFEVLKTRQQLGGTASWSTVAALNIRSIAGAYGSYTSNVAYSLPADVVKFLAYEALTTGLLHRPPGAKIEGLEGACLGAMAGLVSTIVTTPLDVVRTRVMSEESATSPGAAEQQTNPLRVLRDIIDAEGIEAVWTGLTPRAVRALGSGAIQFSSYEITQNFLVGKR